MENLRKGETPRTRSIDPDLQRLLDVQARGKTRMDAATPSSSGGWSLSNRCSVQNLQEVRKNWYVCCGALVSAIYFLSNPCFLRRSKIQSRGITFVLKTTTKKCWSCFSVSFFYLLKKEKNLSIPLGCYSLSNPKRKLLALLASLANLSITIAIKTLGFDLGQPAFVPFARNDPQRNSSSPPQHEKWKAFRRLPQNDDLSKFQK